VQDLTSGYREDNPVVRDFSFDFAPGSVTTVIGPNGAGKSTLLRTIGGLVTAFSGTIELDGQAIERLAPWKRVERGLGFVPQGRCNFPLLSVADNLGCAVLRMPRRVGRERVAQMVERFPLLERKWRQLVGNLSGGEQQIVEMAMVLVRDPSVLLLDEPSLGLSPRAQDEVFGLLAPICARGVTVVMVEQNAHAGLAASDAALVMDQGRLTLHGSADRILADERVREVYLGGAVSMSA
jgi:branched-chain amino acid transport system ATP-binding protein